MGKHQGSKSIGHWLCAQQHTHRGADFSPAPPLRLAAESWASPQDEGCEETGADAGHEKGRHCRLVLGAIPPCDVAQVTRGARRKAGRGPLNPLRGCAQRSRSGGPLPRLETAERAASARRLRRAALERVSRTGWQRDGVEQQRRGAGCSHRCEELRPRPRAGRPASPLHKGGRHRQGEGARPSEGWQLEQPVGEEADGDEEDGPQRSPDACGGPHERADLDAHDAWMGRGGWGTTRARRRARRLVLADYHCCARQMVAIYCQWR